MNYWVLTVKADGNGCPISRAFCAREVGILIVESPPFSLNSEPASSESFSS